MGQIWDRSRRRLLAVRRIERRAAVAALIWLADLTRDASRAFLYAVVPTWLTLTAIVGYLARTGQAPMVWAALVSTFVVGVALIIAGLLPPQAVTE
jgi:hypothetical protein